MFFVPKKGAKEDTNAFIIYPEIKIGENNMIKNSFRIGGANYIKELGNINKRKDYEANDRNNFELYIPNNVLKHKKYYTTILLHIFGGAWTSGDKKKMRL